MKDEELVELSRQIRLSVLRMINRAGSSHIGSCFSMAELLAVLYGDILRVDPDAPEWPERDRFILSKGHAAAALYAVLAERGFFPRSLLKTFYENGSVLAGHATHKGVPGVEVSTGSLGHGLPIACGMALAAQRGRKRHRVFALLSDGECDEGTVWEAALFAGHHRLDNLIVVIDYNKIQSLGSVKDVLGLEPFAGKWRAFGWGVTEVGGHDVKQLKDVLQSVPIAPGRPSCVIAHTVKGKGVAAMEDDLLWHYRCPRDDEYDQALLELRGAP